MCLIISVLVLQYIRLNSVSAVMTLLSIFEKTGSSRSREFENKIPGRKSRELVPKKKGQLVGTLVQLKEQF